MPTFLPKSIFGRLLLLLILIASATQLISSTIWITQLNKEESIAKNEIAEAMAKRLSIVYRYLHAAPSSVTDSIIDQIDGTNIYFVGASISLNKSLPPAESTEFTQLISNYEEQLHKHISDITDLSVYIINTQELTKYFYYLPNKVQNDITLHYQTISYLRHPLVITKFSSGVLKDEAYYQVSLLPIPSIFAQRNYFPIERILTLGVVFIIICGISFFVGRWLTKPLSIFMKAADSLGRNIDSPPIPEQDGSREIRATARAFNAMQRRIKRFVADRGQLLSSISHDLKTPVTRMRLRAELIDDNTVRDKMIHDLAELELMIKGALETVRGTDISEDSEYTNINSLIHDLVEKNDDINDSIIIRGTIDRVLLCKAHSLSRCVTNLVTNAIYYGGNATIILDSDRDYVYITIQDNGDGIPEEHLEQVFDPYYRVEASRNRNTGGTGLGLSIARNIARAHGGDLTLKNRPKGGLEAQLKLPYHNTTKH